MTGKSRKIRKISFNSRTREGCDLINPDFLTALNVSIHAPARGAICVGKFLALLCSFNSRTREGCDVRGLLDK